jgi:hypothetical protein
MNDEVRENFIPPHQVAQYRQTANDTVEAIRQGNFPVAFALGICLAVSLADADRMLIAEPMRELRRLVDSSLPAAGFVCPLTRPASSLKPQASHPRRPA